ACRRPGTCRPPGACGCARPSFGRCGSSGTWLPPWWWWWCQPASSGRVGYLPATGDAPRFRQSVLLPATAAAPVESRAVLALQLDPDDHVPVRRRGVHEYQVPIPHPPLDLAGLHVADCDLRQAGPPAPDQRLAGLVPLLHRRVGRPAPDQALAGVELGYNRCSVGEAPDLESGPGPQDDPIVQPLDR